MFDLTGKTALITGITGQDGSYLSEFLLKKKYIVHGIIRRSSSFNTGRIDHLYQDPHIKNRNFILHYGDITDALSVNSLISKIKPVRSEMAMFCGYCPPSIKDLPAGGVN